MNQAAAWAFGSLSHGRSGRCLVGVRVPARTLRLAGLGLKNRGVVDEPDAQRLADEEDFGARG
jgi:hypothetical protein